MHQFPHLILGQSADKDYLFERHVEGKEVLRHFQTTFLNTFTTTFGVTSFKSFLESFVTTFLMSDRIGWRKNDAKICVGLAQKVCEKYAMEWRERRVGKAAINFL